MNDRALAVVTQSQELARVDAGGLQFTEQQEEMIRANFSTGATKSEFEVLMAIAKARKLNPLLKQVYFVKRKDKKLNKDVWSVQVSIDGLRAIAERTGAYDGQDEPEFEYNADKEIILARVKVYKKGVSRPFVGVARWDEYVQKSYEGNPTKFWADMPYTMLGKCAEALAIRKAFPEDSGGLYVSEEMMQAESAPPDRQLTGGAHSPHDDGGDYSEADGSEYDRLVLKMAHAEDLANKCSSYEQVLELEEYLGSRAKQSELTRAIQTAKEARSITPEQHKVLSAKWQHLFRELTKDKPPGLKARFPAPDAAAAFVDGDDSEDFSRAD